MTNRGLAAACIFFAFVPVAAAGPAAPSWTSFTDPAGNFSIDVPQTPEHATRSTQSANGATIALESYSIDRGDCAVMEIVGDYTGMGLDPARALDDAVTGAQKHDRTLLTNVAVTVDGHPGRDITVSNNKGQLLTDRIFFFGDHLYQTITVVPDHATGEQLSITKRFAQSLHFLR